MQKLKTAKYTNFLFEESIEKMSLSVAQYAIVPNCMTESLQEKINIGYFILKAQVQEFLIFMYS